MKKKPSQRRVEQEPSEELIRDYAQHLYELSGRIPGRDVDNWLEAKACLEACIPRDRSHARLQKHLADVDLIEPPPEAKHMAN